MANELNIFKVKIFDYVESRMTFIAPNLSMIIGASTAAKLLGVAGGLTKLSKIPACNVAVLGAQKKTLAGYVHCQTRLIEMNALKCHSNIISFRYSFSKTQTLPHAGFLYYSQIVQSTTPDLRRKAARLVAAKCTLAARVDACHESINGEIGREFKDDIEKKLDKLQVCSVRNVLQSFSWNLIAVFYIGASTSEIHKTTAETD